MHLDRQRAGELIAGQVRAVAALMRVTEATARTYLGDEIIKDMARRMLFEVAGEVGRRGLMEPRGPFRCRRLSRDHRSRPWPRQCRYGRPANRPIHLRDVITTCAERCPGSGRSPPAPRGKQAGDPAQILFQAGRRRATRPGTSARRPPTWPRAAASPDGIPETAHSQLAATLRRDADALSAITTTDRSLWRQRSYETAPVLGFGTKRPVCTAGSDLTCRAHHRW